MINVIIGVFQDNSEIKYSKFLLPLSCDVLNWVNIVISDNDISLDSNGEKTTYLERFNFDSFTCDWLFLIKDGNIFYSRPNQHIPGWIYLSKSF